MENNYDFSGWATRNNLKCSDGRTIMQNAFKDDDGKRVPLVYAHHHHDLEDVLGHAILENRDDGVYAYGYFNNSEQGQHAKLMVEHGDLTALSIFANNLTQRGGNVCHGSIKEVSLVLAGANPGAFIDSVVAHGENGLEESESEAVIYLGESNSDLSIHHASDDKQADENGEGAKAPDIKKENDEMAEKTVKDVFDTLNEEQKTVVYALIGQALEDAEGGNDEEDDEDMKHNLFEDEDEVDEGMNVLSHEEELDIINDAKRFGSMRESALQHGADTIQHTVDYGFGDNIGYLFPDNKTLTNEPGMIKRDMDWVNVVMNGVHHSPFSRIKSVFANITADEARAKGYFKKGTLKKDEVIALLKRTTDPTTVYKKQKLDRDDVIDITDFNVVAWLKSEMRLMLNEEIARAILIGDGRMSGAEDKIAEDRIRPIAKDEALYTIQAKLTKQESDTADDIAADFIETAIRARTDYKGSGDPYLFTTEEMVTDCLLLKDTTGRDLYTDVSQLAKKLRVKGIITVPVMEDAAGKGEREKVIGIIVNPKDYNVGADKGGSVSMFDDFDIDYNQMKYLIETRCSGALTVPYSAIAINIGAAPM